METEITSETNSMNNEEDVNEKLMKDIRNSNGDSDSDTEDNAMVNIDNDATELDVKQNNDINTDLTVASQSEPEPEIQISRREFLERVQNLYNDIEVQENRIREILKEKEDIEIASYEQGFIQDDVNQYPNILNPQFNALIAKKKEFADTTYTSEIKNIAEESERLCAQDFELAPYQIFVRNFISNQTPYNGFVVVPRSWYRQNVCKHIYMRKSSGLSETTKHLQKNYHCCI
jgi:hypothetical protein